MRIAVGLAKDRHSFRITIFLIVVALAVGIVACDGAGARTYQLTLSSGAGGNVTAPGEGTFPYPAGTVVQLVAIPDDGYQFRTWSGDIERIANPNAASTTITMNGDYAVIASFDVEPGIGPGGGPLP